MSPTDTDQSADTVACLVFQVAGQTFVVSSLRLLEVTEPLSVTPVPNAPDFLEGVICLRGRAVPVVDLRRRLELPIGEIPDTPVGSRGDQPVTATRFVVVRVEGQAVAMRVDAVMGIARLTRHDIQPLPPSLPRPAGVLGLGRHNEQWLILLEPAQILTTDERIGLSELLEIIPETGEGGRGG